eukprot:1554798-Amphidinium_carterae.1
MGIEISVIMLLARWNSSIVLHYAQEAPLRNITDRYKSKARADQDEQNIYHTLQGLVEQVTELRGRAEAVSQPKVESTGIGEAPFVMNRPTSVLHRVAVGTATSMPYLWRASCGWRFASSRFSLHHEDTVGRRR